MGNSRVFGRCVVVMSLTLFIQIQGQSSMFLSATFDQTPLEGLPLVVYDTRQGLTYGAACVSACLERLVTRSCEAFSYDPVNMSCDLYAASAGLPPSSPHHLVFLFKVRDSFNGITVGGRLFLIYLSSVGKTFDEARTHCRNMGGYLLQFDSLEEYDAVALMKEFVNEIEVQSYIGASNAENQWLTDRERLSINSTGYWLWDDFEPNGQSGYCATIVYAKMRMNDVDCGHVFTFWCEMDT